MKYKTIFDLDGTLVHTHPQYRYALFENIFGDLGVSDYTPADVDKFWFEGGRSEFVETTFGVNPHQFWRAYRAHDTPYFRELHMWLYHDVEFLRVLAECGIKMGIVTSAEPAIAQIGTDMMNDQHEIKFDCVVLAGKNGFGFKPHPNSLTHCMSQLGAKPEETLYIGNSTEDIAMAKAAGVRDVFIDRGEHKFLPFDAGLTIYSLCSLAKPLGLRFVD